MPNACIVALAKNEEPYLADWARYHSDLGFKHIFLCDNNDLGVNSQYDLVIDLQKTIDIAHVDIRGREKLESLNLQEGVYLTMIEYIKQHHSDIDWIAFIDCDEYFYFDGFTVKGFLEQDKFANVDLIRFNWMCYGDNDHVFYENRPVMERFLNPLPIDAVYKFDIPPEFCLNSHVKTMYRVSDKPVGFNTPHTMLIEGKCVNVAGEEVDCTSPWQPICYDGGHLKHYITKSTEEFIERKLRNNPLASSSDVISSFDEEFCSYFNVNTKTWSKMQLIHDKTGR